MDRLVANLVLTLVIAATGAGCSLGLDFDDIAACESDEVFDQETEACVCPPSQVRSAADGTCGCPDARMDFDGRGLCQCPDNEVFDEGSQACVCVANQTRPAAGAACECPDSRMRADAAGLCQCPSEYVADTDPDGLPMICECPVELPGGTGIFDLDGDPSTCEGRVANLGTIDLQGDSLRDVAIDTSTAPPWTGAVLLQGVDDTAKVQLIDVAVAADGAYIVTANSDDRLSTVVRAADDGSLFAPRLQAIALLHDQNGEVPAAAVIVSEGPPLVADFVSRDFERARIAMLDGVPVNQEPIELQLAGGEGISAAEGSPVLAPGEVNSVFTASALGFRLKNDEWLVDIRRADFRVPLSRIGPELPPDGCESGIACPGGTCLPVSAGLCNGTPECPGGEDESPTLCGAFECGAGGPGITLSELCTGLCPDADTLFCRFADDECVGQLKCDAAGSACADFSQLCDGTPDCPTNIDERVCPYPCPEGAAPCDDGAGFTCLPSAQFCDGANSCGTTGDDENPYLCEGDRTFFSIGNPEPVIGAIGRYVSSGMIFSVELTNDGELRIGGPDVLGPPTLIEFEFIESTGTLAAQASTAIPELVDTVAGSRAAVEDRYAEVLLNIGQPPLDRALESAEITFSLDGASGSGSELVALARPVALMCEDASGTFGACPSPIRTSGSVQPFPTALDRPTGVVRFSRTPDAIRAEGPITFPELLGDVTGLEAVDPRVVGLDSASRLVVATSGEGVEARLQLVGIDGEDISSPRFEIPFEDTTDSVRRVGLTTEGELIFLQTRTGLRVLALGQGPDAGQ